MRPEIHPDSTDSRVHVALASRTRRLVLDAVARATAPADAHALASGLGLHVTTVRFHLEHLEAAHLVSRQTDVEKRRGRPRIRYLASSRLGEDSREQLIEVLAGALAQRDIGRAQSVEAGHRWADELLATHDDAADGVETLLRLLDGLGFDPLIDEKVIRLRGCPFREAARDHPQVICSVHRGLVERILEARGVERRPELLPFAEPELCLITLHDD
ncbi:helix-turn-helix transcriptional regulator [Luethyella okanaganae]|uniref:Helix-turn-helix transcriptional regulator n=1 Tax=Luethyella okanaganae TaxID=69372 RepID=A0ABW1VKJ2_9MICO